MIDVREWFMAHCQRSKHKPLQSVTRISCLERAVEYILRAPLKNGEEDLKKAEQYLHRAIHGEWPLAPEKPTEIEKSV